MIFTIILSSVLFFLSGIEIGCWLSLEKIKEQNEKNITLCIHPYIEAYIKKGIFNLQWKWFLNYGRWIKVKAEPSYHLTEFHFLNSKEEEIKL